MAGNDKLDNNDREQAFNCTCRAGQIISKIKLAMLSCEKGERTELREEMPGLQGVIVFTRIFGPPGLQQDDQDFENWKKDYEGGMLGGIYFSWPRGKPAVATVHVTLPDKKVTLRLSGEVNAEEAYQFASFAHELQTYLNGKELPHIPVESRKIVHYNYGMK